MLAAKGGAVVGINPGDGPLGSTRTPKSGGLGLTQVEHVNETEKEAVRYTYRVNPE